MKIHHVSGINQLFLWPLSIAMLSLPEGNLNGKVFFCSSPAPAFHQRKFQVQSQLTECPFCSTGVTQLEMDAHLLQCKAAMLGEDGFFFGCGLGMEVSFAKIEVQY